MHNPAVEGVDALTIGPTPLSRGLAALGNHPQPCMLLAPPVPCFPCSFPKRVQSYGHSLVVLRRIPPHHPDGRSGEIDGGLYPSRGGAQPRAPSRSARELTSLSSAIPPLACGRPAFAPPALLCGCLAQGYCPLVSSDR